MKFARYLEETQTPEWKRAYIDYRGLKKRISAIRRAQQGLEISPSSSQEDLNIAAPRASDLSQQDNPLSGGRRGSVESHRSGVARRRNSHVAPASPIQEENGLSNVAETDDGVSSGRQAPARGGASSRGRRPSFAQRLSMRTGIRGHAGSISRQLSLSQPPHPLASLPLRDLLFHLCPVELAFFSYLDNEHEKIENFYLDREKEMTARTKLLRDQLDELRDHRKLFHQAQSANLAWPILENINLRLRSKLPRNGSSNRGVITVDRPGSDRGSDAEAGVPQQSQNESPRHSGNSDMDDTIHEGALARMTSGLKSLASSVMHLPIYADDNRGETTSGAVTPGGRAKKQELPRSLDPDDYLYAKKKLKKAIIEHYRGLEMLHNYRILNITGFRKALKKFEKLTKIPAQKQYMGEKVEQGALASDKSVRAMIKEMEEMYAEDFLHGDKKRATARLRGGRHIKSHHYSTFRSGMFLGFALPAFVSGLYEVLHESAREEIPGWDGLLFIYGILLIPTLFSILVGLNLLVWARSRINYVFIFELDVRTRLDHREYFETPSILLAGLCYAFWLSFLRLGAPAVSPTIWPLVWLGFVAVVMLDPFPILFKPSRYWLAKNVGKLFISGTRRVEFTDFWMGDQFCSLIFSLSNLPLLVCVYADGLDESWRKCGTSSRYWPVAFAVAVLPLLIRLVQSIKRYADSGLTTHLINGGKYGSGIIANLFYFIWRHQGNTHGTILVFWCLFNTIYSIYASSWDLLMDWSVLRPHSNYPLLRTELVYTNYIPLYYFAMVSNVILRFIWVIYIPKSGPNIMARTFIGGILEILRRWQWNFYRLENEHLGNMDQYRVTREVPLPYSFEDAAQEDDADDDGELRRISR